MALVGGTGRKPARQSFSSCVAVTGSPSPRSHCKSSPVVRSKLQSVHYCRFRDRGHLSFGTLVGMLNLQLVRQDRALSKAETARLVRVLPEVYSLIERGLLSPSSAQAERLEKAFGSPIGHLSTRATPAALGAHDMRIDRDRVDRAESLLRKGHSCRAVGRICGISDFSARCIKRRMDGDDRPMKSAV